MVFMSFRLLCGSRLRATDLVRPITCAAGAQALACFGTVGSRRVRPDATLVRATRLGTLEPRCRPRLVLASLEPAMQAEACRGSPTSREARVGVGGLQRCTNVPNDVPTHNGI